MSTLSVTTINTANGTTNLSITTGNTSNPSIVISSATGTTTFGNSLFNAVAFTSTSNNNYGVVGYSNTSIGVLGLSNTVGVQGTSNVGGTGVNATSNSGIGLYAQSNTGTIAQFTNATATVAVVNSTGLIVTGNASISTNNFILGNTGTGAYNNTAAAGYTVLPNQLKMNWGVVVPNSVGGNAITFASPFTSNTYGLSLTVYGSTTNVGTANAKTVTISSVTNSGITIYTSNTTVSVNTGVLGVYYMAIGPA